MGPDATSAHGHARRATPLPRVGRRAGYDPAVPLQRIAWLVTVVAALITGALLLLSGYQGYAALACAVAVSAAINLV